MNQYFQSYTLINTTFVTLGLYIIRLIDMTYLSTAVHLHMNHDCFFFQKVVNKTDSSKKQCHKQGHRSKKSDLRISSQTTKSEDVKGSFGTI